MKNMLLISIFHNELYVVYDPTIKAYYIPNMCLRKQYSQIDFISLLHELF